LIYGEEASLLTLKEFFITMSISNQQFSTVFNNFQKLPQVFNMVTAQSIISMCGMNKVFGGVHTLKDVEFDAHPGEVQALFGENGAGKSTLIKIVTGDQPESGEMLLNGEPVQFSNPRDAQSAAIVPIYQEPNLFPDLDIAEDIYVGRLPITIVSHGSGHSLCT